MSTTSAERTVLVPQEDRTVYLDSKDNASRRIVYVTEEN